jgi:hypothetical protein
MDVHLCAGAVVNFRQLARGIVTPCRGADELEQSIQSADGACQKQDSFQTLPFAFSSSQL